MLNVGPKRIRAVTHYGITAADIDHALAVLEEAMRPASGQVPAGR